ncbi:MAG: phage integrase N-terminal SAM-like domain-containing protein [Candidatus Tectomicrobia bacterium]|uniref:Phage integrase N-terminal SAM-like domain-containing protein n=1 Tax=Tectimicrobiota bacterium TaxID=2528274 RepID=A0A933GNE5_UNCTE|nr:phage integrase N-terminal SAM-like domain-containing protein [Candidatus Tectomicrobia bacterium]
MCEESQKPTEAAQKFWDAFKACVEENRVRPDRSPFYVKWAQAYVDFLPGKRLRDRSKEDIDAFLADLGKRSGIQDWQIRQAEHALRILYEDFLPKYAPAGPAKRPAEIPKKTRVASKAPKAGTFRDRVVAGEVERLFSPVIDTLKTEIRSRNYSIRTETTYLDCVRHFIAFHGYVDPRGIDGGAAVKEYLDYLAVDREVAALVTTMIYTHVLNRPGLSVKSPADF